MSRLPRKIYAGEYYHVIVKGNADQTIFEDNNDRKALLNMISISRDKFYVEILAYCLMGNHFHLLIKDDADNLSSFMKSALGRYANYFNRKYDRNGTLFNGRFKSETITDDSYLLCVMRYIHRNPQAAYIEDYKTYRWSSYSDYVNSYSNGINNTGSFVNTSIIMQLIRSRQSFDDFMNNGDDILCICDYTDPFESDDEVIAFLNRKYGFETPKAISKMDVRTRNEYIKEWKELGITCKQISRITGVNIYTVYKIF